MNLQTFRKKEFYTYLIPLVIIDFVFQYLVYTFVASKVGFTNPEDAIMLKKRVIYFLFVGYLIATVIAPPTIYRRGLRWSRIVVNAFMQTLLTYTIFALSVRFLFVSFHGVLFLYCGIAGTVVISAVNVIAKLIINRARKHGRNKLHVIMVGSDENAVTLYRHMKRDLSSEFKVLGMFTDYEAPEDINVLGSVDDVKAYVDENKVHGVYCSISPAQHPEVVDSIVRLCEDSFIRFYYVPNMDGYPKRSMNFSRIGDVNVCCLREEPLRNPVNRFWKRTMDLVICFVFFVFFFPWLYLIIATGIKLSSPGPVFFKQKRTGYHGKPFYVYKFRSMKVNADADKLQATSDDPRKTKFGDFLRRSSLDELPQFINVLKGDMSAIGPRPHMEKQTIEYEALIDKYMLRHLCKPGISGWAQVNGYRGETSELEQMAGRVKYDIWYIENWSLLLDLKIFVKTFVQCVIKDDKQAY